MKYTHVANVANRILQHSFIMMIPISLLDRTEQNVRGKNDLKQRNASDTNGKNKKQLVN